MASNEPVTNGLKPLTPKALKFCELVAKGQRVSEAYCNSYEVQYNTKKASIHAAAGRLMGDPRVRRQIERLKEKDAAAVFQQAVGLRQWTLDRLKDEATDKENPPAARVTALGLLARASRLIESGSQQSVNVNVATVNRSASEIERELLDRLASLTTDSHSGNDAVDGEILPAEDEGQDDAGPT